MLTSLSTTIVTFAIAEEAEAASPAEMPWPARVLSIWMM